MNTLISSYPIPILAPNKAMQTTYGREFCVEDGANQFARSRTMEQANTSIYPVHGTGTFQQPYYRRDSKGYRQTYAQSGDVDLDYASTRDERQTTASLNASLTTFAHPSSFQNYPALAANERANLGRSEDAMEQFLQSRTQEMGHTAILGDPMPLDHHANANRKPRTTYKRAFGQCR